MFTHAHKEEAKDDIVHKSRHAANTIRNGTRRVKDDVSNDIGESVDAVKEDLQDIARTAGRHFRAMANSTEENMAAKIRDNPLQSNLIALAVGVALGVFLIRR